MIRKSAPNALGRTRPTPVDLAVVQVGKVRLFRIEDPERAAGVISFLDAKSCGAPRQLSTSVSAAD